MGILPNFNTWPFSRSSETPKPRERTAHELMQELLALGSAKSTYFSTRFNNGLQMTKDEIRRIEISPDFYRLHGEDALRSVAVDVENEVDGPRSMDLQHYYYELCGMYSLWDFEEGITEDNPTISIELRKSGSNPRTTVKIGVAVLIDDRYRNITLNNVITTPMMVDDMAKTEWKEKFAKLDAFPEDIRLNGSRTLAWKWYRHEAQRRYDAGKLLPSGIVVHAKDIAKIYC